MDDWDVLVIGGGPAGVTAALRARECGAARVALVERGTTLGGTCTNDGCVPTRVWAKAARHLRDAAQAAEYGVGAARDGGEAVPALDFARLQERTRETVRAVHDKKRLAERLAEAGVEVIAGRGGARFADAHTVVLGGGEAGGAATRLRADRFVLCAGGHARRPPFPGGEWTLGPTDLWALASLPRRVVVVGAAATGCQVASMLNAFGSEVTLLEVAPRLLPQEDAAISMAMADALARRGVRVEVGVEHGVASVEKNEGGGGALLVRWGENGAAASAEADVVVSATGWPGSVEALGLEAAGVATTDDGAYVAVDDALRSVSAPHVWAAGDLTGRMMLVQCAYDDARIAGANAARGSADPADDPASRLVPHGGFTDPEYGSVGLTEEQARERGAGAGGAGGDVLAATVPFADLDRALIDGHPDGFCKLVADGATGRVLGVHVVGEQALEVAQAAAAGMAAGARVDDLADLEFAYPTITAVLGLAARQACRLAGRPAAGGAGAERQPEWEVKRRA